MNFPPSWSIPFEPIHPFSVSGPEGVDDYAFTHVRDFLFLLFFCAPPPCLNPNLNAWISVKSILGRGQVVLKYFIGFLEVNTGKNTEF